MKLYRKIALPTILLIAFTTANNAQSIPPQNVKNKSTATSAKPSLSGKLAFHNYTTYGAGDGELYIYDFQDSTLTNISSSWPIDHEINPHFSPDGTMLVFMGFNQGTSDWDVFLWTLGSGSNPVNLTNARNNKDEDPKFSADGTKIIYKERYWSGSFKYRFQEMNLSGVIVNTIDPPGDYEVSMPFYTADGLSVLYARGAGASSDIYKIDTNGTGDVAVQSAGGIQEYYPINIDSQQYLFTRWVSGADPTDQVFVGYHNGNPATSLAFNDNSNYSDAYPLNNQYIVFSSTRSGGQGGYDLYIGDTITGEVWSMNDYHSGINSTKEELGASYSPVNLYGDTLTYFVAKHGNDSNPGTLLQPWLTIQKACNDAASGSRVYIMEGTYNEKVTVNVSGTVGNYISFSNYNSDTVIIDGTGVGGITMLEISGKSYLKFSGLNIQNCIGNDSQGILIDDSSHHIEIRNNRISKIHFSSNPGDPANPGTNSQPLIVYGTDPANPISDLIIDGNEIFDSRTGYSEGLAVNGNVDGFEITNNTVHHITNIGIDMIGHEGTCSAPAFDQARNGICSGNTVYNCTSAYATAAGIYVDGARDIIIEKNILYRNQWGIEVGCENTGKTTSGITMRNNLIYNNATAGIVMGGYDYPSGSGKVTTSYVYNNSCFNNDTSDTYNGELSMTYTENCDVRNNIFRASGQNVLLVLDVTPLNLTLDYNLYYCPDGEANAEIYWDGTDYQGFSNYVSGTSQDVHSAFADPQFVYAQLPFPDLHIVSGSPARNHGDPGTSASITGPSDFDGYPRFANDTIDAGAYEFYKIWQGNISADWSEGLNWFPPGVPTVTTDVIIPAQVNHSPQIPGDSSSLIRSLHINPKASVVISPDGSLIIH